MKTLGIIVFIILIIFFGIQVYISKSSKEIENYPYDVLEKMEGFEIRLYESRLFSKTTIASGKYETASKKGFSTLAGYIFGGNEKKQKISMTSPVAMSLEDSITMMFMVPYNCDLASLPKPNDPSIEFEQKPSKKVAAVSFGGYASSKIIEEKKKLLIGLLKQSKIDYKDEFYFLGYNPPFEIINRKNEIIVTLK